MKPELWEQPIFFARNRVSRVYRGGLLFSNFLGDAKEDGFYPEEWIASNVRALNSGHTDPLEGISRTEESGIPFSKLLSETPEKYLGTAKTLAYLSNFWTARYAYLCRCIRPVNLRKKIFTVLTARLKLG